MRKNIGYEYIKELDSYFREIQNIRKLSEKEERELSVRIKQGDREALNDLVYHNLRFVVILLRTIEIVMYHLRILFLKEIWVYYTLLLSSMVIRI